MCGFTVIGLFGDAPAKGKGKTLALTGRPEN